MSKNVKSTGVVVTGTKNKGPVLVFGGNLKVIFDLFRTYLLDIQGFEVSV
jgi:hypothetical protein